MHRWKVLSLSGQSLNRYCVSTMPHQYIVPFLMSWEFKSYQNFFQFPQSPLLLTITPLPHTTCTQKMVSSTCTLIQTNILSALPNRIFLHFCVVVAPLKLQPLFLAPPLHSLLQSVGTRSTIMVYTAAQSTHHAGEGMLQCSSTKSRFASFFISL